MLRFAVLVAGLVSALSALPAMPEPGELALVLNEEEFEDYLDEWLAVEEPKWANATKASARSGKKTQLLEISFMNIKLCLSCKY